MVVTHIIIINMHLRDLERNPSQFGANEPANPPMKPSAIENPTALRSLAAASRKAKRFVTMAAVRITAKDLAAKETYRQLTRKQTHAVG